ncbi:MAG: TldD/PmbA family protein [Acidobacteria bacterium]|nr:TldD/PmbA family protein [Acidobacteriota bacterium]
MKYNKDFAMSLVSAAMHKGASAAEVMMIESSEFSVGVRLGEVEKLKDSASSHLGLRVLWEGRQAALSTSDFSKDALEQLVRDAVELAQMTSVDNQLCLPEPSEFAKDWPDLALYDKEIAEMPTDKKIALGLDVEKAAKNTDPRIINFDGGGFDTACRSVIMANSLGFVGSYESSACSLAIVPIAAENGKMQQDYWYDNKRKISSLESPESIGRRAAERAVRKLGAKKVKTQQVPIVFDQRVATSLLGDIFQAISGDAIMRKSSFLVGKLEEKIASDLLTVIDDGRIASSLGSRPFDSDGLPTQKTIVIDKGKLNSYLLNTYTAKKLGLKSTGNATRGLSGPPSVTCNNFFIEAGKFSPKDIISSVKNGFFVTDLMGFGVNIVTGDYSRGASGMWIENGELTFPVEEVTIAGNLKEMLKEIEMVGNDLDFRDRISAPTLKIEKMIVSGE